MTKLKILLLGLAAVALIIGVIVTLSLVFKHSTPSQTPVTTFPVANSTSTGTSSTQSPIMAIAVQNGGKLTTKDFIHNGVTLPDPANEGRFVLAGSLGYCTPGTPCTATQSTEYNILFDQSTQSFTIALLTEPLGKSRHDAEVYLQGLLGISKDQMCALNYYIGTTYTVNETYAGDSLGFSSCPGAVTLPQ